MDTSVAIFLHSPLQTPVIERAAVQVDLVNLLDLNLLQAAYDDEDDGVEMDKSAHAEVDSGDHKLQEQMCKEQSSNFISKHFCSFFKKD